ncbi:hypothetical protein [uncultured Capnocytophaga sp.]|uniref:hypothetical protein n=1 Tax=uncultured Capnocytophaga sp. TaxID=159273 RepID=UPI00261977B2|nr:hypothetical protein [uncultured Capnocytophaga sp.]
MEINLFNFGNNYLDDSSFFENLEEYASFKEKWKKRGGKDIIDEMFYSLIIGEILFCVVDKNVFSIKHIRENNIDGHTLDNRLLSIEKYNKRIFDFITTKRKGEQMELFSIWAKEFVKIFIGLKIFFLTDRKELAADYRYIEFIINKITIFYNEK